jgi:hypothetical protein
MAVGREMQFRLPRYAKDNGPGAAISILLHLLLVLLAVSVILKHSGETSSMIAPAIPVDLVRLGANTEMPWSKIKSPVPQQSAPLTVRHEAASPADNAVSPNGTHAARDSIDAKLRALARLRQPDTKLNLDSDAGLSNVTAGDGSGNRAMYSVKDYVRAQVLRRWSLDLKKLGGRKLTVHIRMEMKRNGAVTHAEIVEDARNDDALLRDIATSALNAVLLSSPIVLPPGDYPAEMHFVLDLDPRDAQH